MGQRIRRMFIYAFLILVTVLFGYFFLGNPKPVENVKWGVTFSKDYTEFLGLDWKKTYIAILDELSITHLRIAIPWTHIEPEEGEYVFDDYHFMIEEAQARGVAVLPVIGHRVPRWPECHTPEWVKKLSDKERAEKTLELIEKEVKELKKHKGITAWQVENEPFVRLFGECDKISPELLGREIERVKQYDDRPIVVTDSGELGLWSTSLNQADILGVTMYRWVWNKWFDYVKYPLTPKYYYRRAQLVADANPDARVIGSELQMEPWIAEGSVHDTPLDEQRITMNIDQFNENIEFARRTGMDEHYLWGVEWWYWMKEKKGDGSFWREAQRLWQ